MYLQIRLGARSCLFSFAAVVKVPVTGLIAVLLKNKSEQAWLVLPLLALGVRSGSGRGGVLAAPLHWHQRQGVTGLASSRDVPGALAESLQTIVCPGKEADFHPDTAHDSESMLEPFSVLSGLQNTMTGPDLIPPSAARGA